MSDMELLAGLLAPPESSGRFYGVVVGVVTNTQDPDQLGRVKVRFPWLSDQDESRWARLLTPMAGNRRGLYFPPEIDDEVLVAFEHGQVDFPYVLGALWNGKDALPEKNDDGQNNKRTIKSRSGHIIRLDDTDGAEKIEIVDGSGSNRIVISTADNTITIAADADITIQSGSGKLKLSGNGVEVSSQAGITMQAQAGLKLAASGQLDIKGSLVNIN